MQRPVNTARHQGLVVHPGNGGAQLAAGGPGGHSGGRVEIVFGRGCLGGRSHDPVAARYIDLAVQDDAGAGARRHVAGAAGMVEHLGHGGQLAAGENLHRRARRYVACCHTAPEHAAALRGVRGRGRGFFDPLHRESQRQCRVGRRVGQCFKHLQQRGAFVAAPARVGVHHVPALEGRHRHSGAHVNACGLGKTGQSALDVLPGQHRVLHRVELVHSEHQRVYAQQMGQQAVAAGLRQQGEVGVLPVELGGIDQHHGGIGAAGGGDHVARVLLVARRVANDELARFGGEVAVGHVDGDALLALGGQAIGQQGQVGLAAALHAGQVVLQHGLAVHQQAANQRALAVVHAAAGDELQRGNRVICAVCAYWYCASSY